ncbi:nucleolar protein NOP58 [Geopyxis carbonaria]|nr:nucleolar protein NOP58 [Geopyxis carbonaria]
MTFLILAETSAGYAIFKAKDKKLLKKGDELATEMSTPEGAAGLLKLKQFAKFDSAATALEEVTALVESRVSPMLENMLSGLKDEKKASLVVADPKLGNAINKLPGLSLSIISDSTTADLYRGIREHLTSLIPGLTPTDVNTMSLGLSHSLSRHKLKFSADKVDTMIVQAIALLDDLDKELNTYAMRVKEWYGWHFPEMAKIINDNMAYARVIIAMGMRSSCATTDLSEILEEEMEAQLKTAAEVSMGTEITDIDLTNIKALAEQVISFAEYRIQLSSYLTARMNAIAPNLTVLVGELVGARLIAHAGSLLNLSKAPASTLQILGAEKALFRALKTKHDTPKYGLIYHASLIGQSTGKTKGKVARMLAAKASLGSRYDAFNEDKADGDDEGALGLEMRRKVENRMRHLEGRPALPREERIPSANKPGKTAVKDSKTYNADADAVMEDAPPADAVLKGALAMDIDGAEESEDDEEAERKKKEEKRKRKEEKKRRKSNAGADGDVAMTDGEAVVKESKKEKKEKKKRRKSEVE